MFYPTFFSGFSGVVVTELPPRRQEYNFTLESTIRGFGREEVTLLKRDFRLGITQCHYIVYIHRQLILQAVVL